MLALCVRNYLAWANVPANESPLAAYLLSAIVPTLASTAFIAWSGRQRFPMVAQLVGGAAIGFLLIPGTLLFGAYVLG
jgi:hypothetical protein